MYAKSVRTNNHPAIEVFPDDIFLVSYPKSGNTWLGFMIGNYLSGNQCNFAKLPSLIPDVYFNPEHIPQLPKPRIIKSHEPFVADYSRVVYIARDGRDVAVSYYFFALKCRHQYTQFTSETTFEEFVNTFNTGEIAGFTLWSDHVNCWLDRAKDDFLLIKYEDMKANPAAELIRFLNFAGIAVDVDRVAQAVEASTFKTMQKLEQEQFQQLEQFDSSDPTIQFVRKGEVGNWQDFFTDQMLANFIEIHGSALERLSYLPPRITAGFKARKVEFLALQAEQQQTQLQLQQTLQHVQNQYEQLQTKFAQVSSQHNHLTSELEQTKNQQRQAKSLYQQNLQHQSAQHQVLQQQLQTQLAEQQVRSQQLQTQLAEQQVRSQQLQGKLKQVRERSQTRQQNLKVKLEQTQAVIQAMESSKFWQLRAYWHKFKSLLNLTY